MSNASDHDQFLLEGYGLTHGFAGRVLFSDLDIRIGTRQITILRGDNGTGKTTLLRMLAGLLPPLAGLITVTGTPLRDDRVHAARNMVFIGHRDGLAAELTARESIELWAQTRGLAPSQQDIEKAFDLLSLGHCTDQPVRVLSAGQRRRCGMVRLALIATMDAHHQIPVWLLDEPTTAMDDNAVSSFAGLIEKHAGSGGGVLLTSHLDLPLKKARNIRLGELQGEPR